MVESKSPFVSIPASLGGIFMIICILFLIFAKENLDVLIKIAWAFVVLGVFSAFFALLATKKGKK